MGGEICTKMGFYPLPPTNRYKEQQVQISNGFKLLNKRKNNNINDHSN